METTYGTKKITLYDAQYFQPKVEEDPTEVGVIIEGQHYTGFWENNSWWIHYGGVSVGHMKTDWNEVEYWYYLNKYDDNKIDES